MSDVCMYDIHMYSTMWPLTSVQHHFIYKDHTVSLQRYNNLHYFFFRIEYPQVIIACPVISNPVDRYYLILRFSCF